MPPFRLDPDLLRGQILGSGFRFPTPFGPRLLVYADYTASGRCLAFVEDRIAEAIESYANTHTEDDVTGRSTTRLLHEAVAALKRGVGGDDDTRLIAVGTGATGAIQKLQEILGVYIPPATREFLLGRGEMDPALEARRPVVFVSGYEHHSNEISWRESLARVIPVDFDADGGVDLADLEQRLSDPGQKGRLLIGAFSAASNVTGIRTPVHQVARILHRHGALACFDFAASAPYVPIDMNRDGESYFDALFLSPHKFLGGPGSCGLLFFNRRIYRADLPPTLAAGGTVQYVGPAAVEYAPDIETRERAGTPGTLQILKAALALGVKEAVGTQVIEAREQAHLRALLGRFERHGAVEVLGNPDPARRIGIISFNIRARGRHLHPKLVTRLLNDLFGIQSRAGCSCAGPYGHRLLGIGRALSERYQDLIHRGLEGIKPGWVRLSLHYTMDELDRDYIGSAVEFVADHGARLLRLYGFDPATGAWTHAGEPPDAAPSLDVEEAWDAAPRAAAAPVDRAAEYRRNLEFARALAAGLPEAPPPDVTLPGMPEEMAWFPVARIVSQSPPRP